MNAIPQNSADSASLAARDLRVLWHPCTQMKDHETLPMVAIRRASGAWLEDFGGKRYLDAVSSWWVNLFGHANPRINAALAAQLDKLEHVIFAGFTHEPAVRLGALAIGNVELYKTIYKPLLMDVLTAPSPDCHKRDSGESWESFSLRQFVHTERLLAEHSAELAAVIVEPLVQCAGGMRMYHPVYLARLRDACRHYGVHLIADEIAVGFGRTGTLFACEQAAISPDFMCLSKGLTGGYLPLSAVLTTEEVYAAFYDDYANLTAFLHSHSYTGNPLACTAALATLEIFAAHDTIERNREPYPWQERRGQRIYRHSLQNGVLLRPIGDVVYFMPPYIVDEAEMDLMVQVAADGIELATCD